MNFILNFQILHTHNPAFEVDGENDYNIISYDIETFIGYIRWLNINNLNFS